MLAQTLSLVCKDYSSDFKYSFVTNSKEFKEDVLKYIKLTKKDFSVTENEIIVDDKIMFLYENQHYVYHTNGYYKQLTADDLLTTVKLQKQIHEKMWKKCISVFKGEWISLSSIERQRKIENLLQT